MLLSSRLLLDRPPPPRPLASPCRSALAASLSWLRRAHLSRAPRTLAPQARASVSDHLLRQPVTTTRFGSETRLLHEARKRRVGRGKVSKMKKKKKTQKNAKKHTGNVFFLSGLAPRTFVVPWMIHDTSIRRSTSDRQFALLSLPTPPHPSSPFFPFLRHDLSLCLRRLFRSWRNGARPKASQCPFPGGSLSETSLFAYLRTRVYDVFSFLSFVVSVCLLRSPHACRRHHRSTPAVAARPLISLRLSASLALNPRREDSVARALALCVGLPAFFFLPDFASASSERSQRAPLRIHAKASVASFCAFLALQHLLISPRTCFPSARPLHPRPSRPIDGRGLVFATSPFRVVPPSIFQGSLLLVSVSFSSTRRRVSASSPFVFPPPVLDTHVHTLSAPFFPACSRHTAPPGRPLRRCAACICVFPAAVSFFSPRCCRASGFVPPFLRLQPCRPCCLRDPARARIRRIRLRLPLPAPSRLSRWHPPLGSSDVAQRTSMHPSRTGWGASKACESDEWRIGPRRFRALCSRTRARARARARLTWDAGAVARIFRFGPARAVPPARVVFGFLSWVLFDRRRVESGTRSIRADAGRAGVSRVRRRPHPRTSFSRPSSRSRCCARALAAWPRAWLAGR